MIRLITTKCLQQEINERHQPFTCYLSIEFSFFQYAINLTPVIGQISLIQTLSYLFIDLQRYTVFDERHPSIYFYSSNEIKRKICEEKHLVKFVAVLELDDFTDKHG
jgi:hypothetical protein